MSYYVYINNVIPWTSLQIILPKIISKLKITWLAQTNINANGVSKYDPVLLLIDDKNGKILIDINKYQKNIYGEEKFIVDFNAILRNRD